MLHGVFARLVTLIDFDAVDDRPVDLIFMLIARRRGRRSLDCAGARLARCVTDVGGKIRASSNADAIYALLTGFAPAVAA